MFKNKWKAFTLLLTCGVLVSSFFAGYYWIKYTDIIDRISGTIIYTNIGVDYGNNTRTFYNDTKALAGATLFDVTKQACNMTYNVTPYGTEVTSINGVSKQGSFGWTYWVLNATENKWNIVWENADVYRVVGGETFMWYYQNGFNSPP